MKTNKFSKHIALCLSFLIAFTLLNAFKTQTHMAKAETIVTEEIWYGEDYCNTGDYTAVAEEESFEFATKTETSAYISDNFPDYHKNDYSINNACAPVAASNIVGFYDRWYNNLIPDYETGFTLGTMYLYNNMTYQVEKKDALINSLYTYMGTNVVNPGTTKTQYNNGLTAYVNDCGKNISYYSVMNGNTFSFEKLQEQITLGRPVTFFCSGYNFTSIALTDDYVIFEKSIFSTNHVFVVYGYKIYSFYEASGDLLTTKIILGCSSGMPGGLTYYLLNNNGNINDAEGTLIY